MMKKIVYLFLFIFIGCCIYYIKFYEKDLYSGYTYNVKPQADFLNDVLKAEYGDKYKLYTAYFNQDEPVPDIGGYNPNAILWLGRQNFNYQRGDVKNIKDYGIVLCSNFDHLLAVKMLGAKRFYQFSEFMLNSSSGISRRPQYYALIGTPQYVEEILKKQKLLYKKYTYANIEKLRTELSNIKAIFIERNSRKYNINTVFLEAIHAGIIIGENKVELITSSQALLGEIIEYYFNKEELANIIRDIEQNRNQKKELYNKQWVSKFFSKEASKKRLISILENKKYQELDDKWINFYIRNNVGFHPAGDTWLAKDVIKKLNKDYNYYLTFEDTTYRPQSFIQILLVGRIDSIEDENTSDNGILWLAFPHLSKGTSVKTFEEYMTDIENLKTHFKYIVVSSKRMWQYLKNKGIKSVWIPQFTNTDKFYPDYDKDKEAEILFVGNNHFKRRSANIAKKYNLPITIYGNYWPKGWTKADYIDNRILRKYYSSAKIVLSDQNKYMVDFGVIANRVYDATACKTLVISEYVDAIKEVYGDCIPMYKTEEEFVHLVNYYLTHENERLQKAQCAYEITLKNFTAESAARKFDAIINEINQNN